MKHNGRPDWISSLTLAFVILIPVTALGFVLAMVFGIAIADTPASQPVGPFLFFALLGAANAIFCSLMARAKLDGSTPFDHLAGWLVRRYAHQLSTVELGVRKGVIVIHSAITIVLTINIAYMIATGTQGVELLAVALMLCAGVFLVISSNRLKGAILYLYLGALMLLPILVEVFAHTNAPTTIPYNFIWLATAPLIALFFTNQRLSTLCYTIFNFLLYTASILQIYCVPGIDREDSFWFYVDLIFWSFAVYSLMSMYKVQAGKSHDQLEQSLTRLNETRDIISQKDKMASLGQLVAGVAHEINTPMGAIKAFGEIMESSRENVFRALIFQTRHLSDDDIEDFFKLADIYSRCVREMRGTMEARQARAQVKKLLADYDLVPDCRAEVFSLLQELELFDIEKLEQNIDLFKSPNILELLTLLEKTKTYILAEQNIQVSSNRVSKIVFALRSYAHSSDVSEFSGFDLVRNIDNILLLHHNQLKHGIVVKRDYAQNLPQIVGNPDELGQVWTNLIQNAIYAMQGVGTLTIGLRRDGGDVVVAFSDTGAGIEPEHLEKIFEVFFTTKPLGEGSGLGLDICRQIVQRHGGQISAESGGGRGTTLTVRLPIRQK